MRNLAFRGLRLPRLGAMAGGFSPASLFGVADDGWYWQPSLDTMFTTTAGLAPATVGDSFGLQLDRSKGLVPGPELVTNGADGFSDTSGISATGNVTISVAGGELTVTHATAANGAFVLLTGLIIGRAYLYTARGRNAPGSNSWTGIVSASGSTAPQLTNTGGTLGLADVEVSLRFVATETSHRLYLFAQNGAAYPSTAIFSKLSVRLLPGRPGVQGTLAARMVLRQAANGSYYYESDAVDDFLQTGMNLASKRMTVAMAFRPLARTFMLLSNAGVNSPWAIVGQNGSGATLLQHSAIIHSIYFDNVLFSGTTRGQIYTAAQAAKSIIMDFTASATAWANPTIGKYGFGEFYSPGDTFATLAIDREITATERANLTATLMKLVP